MYISFFLIPVLALCPSGETDGGQSEDNCTLCTQILCTYCSTVLDQVCILNICFRSSQTWCLFLLLPFTCEKLINLRCSFSVLRINTGVKGGRRRREVNVKVLTRRLVFYRKRYLRFYILGPTRKRFDVHILSINVDIHYIGVLIKYFFLWKIALTVFV